MTPRDSFGVSKTVMTLFVVAGVLLAGPLPVRAADALPTAKTLANTSTNTSTNTPSTAVAANGAFAQPMTLRGTLGGKPIQMRLHPKADPAEGLEGDYFFFGRSGNILLAGEAEGNALMMEESVNGKDVSGHWDGTREGDIVRGTWSSPDDTQTQPFDLHIELDLPKYGKQSPGTRSGQ